MAMHTTVITRKGQVTIPVEIRRDLNLAEGEHVAMERHGDVVLLRRATSVAERTAGALAAYRRQPALTPDEEQDAFEAAVAAEVAGTDTR